MDNITHSLIGGVVAAGALEYRRKRGPVVPTGLVAGFYLTSVIANNLPDLDMLYCGITPGKLGYLLHHRGYTHSLAAILPMALVTLALLWLWQRRQHWNWTRAEIPWILGLAASGGFLHIGADGLNSYGVHPFSPFFDGWFFGDTLFIIEPLLWLSLGAAFFFDTNRFFKWGSGLFAAVTVLVGFVTPWISRRVAVTTLLFALGLAGLAWGMRRRWILGATAAGAVVLTFAGSSFYLRARIHTESAREFPGSVLHDVVLSPLPANPFCWLVITVEENSGMYTARRAIAAPFPAIEDAFACARAFPISPAGYSEVSKPSTAERFWLGQFETPVETLRLAGKSSCVVNAFYRFARVPFLRPQVPLFQVGDLRFGWAERSDFAQLTFDGSEACPPHVPSWNYPRSELLRSSGVDQIDDRN